MNDAIKVMLDRYNCQSVNDYENALKEIIQEIALLGLWRSKFFEKAAFYGGSALRILYGLDRFSEDLDFSLLKKDKKFSIESYCKAVEEELKSFGFSVSVQKKEKTVKTNIESAFIKGGTLNNMIIIEVPEIVKKKIHSGRGLKIKLEVDIDPPADFKTEAKYILHPMPFSVNAYALPYLYAGKMHAILCRSWSNRVKGRDWYDLVWYIARGESLSLKHLYMRMKQSGHLNKYRSLTEYRFIQLLQDKIDSTDFENAKKDVEPLLKDPLSIVVWSKEFFSTICKKIKII
ncbi:MAG: nucleotidyl transferase AbiEii/AbiGii toxin family protein [Candidatus Omnitrophica bacterium]|nr:nucleotidyl transferase AbiEii/AbiGii toxin family protein [Candidatus Omnitrophota bacterium]